MNTPAIPLLMRTVSARRWLLATAWMILAGGALPAVEAAPTTTVLFVLADQEYDTATSLRDFAAKELIPRGMQALYAEEDPADKADLRGLEALAKADLLVVSARRHSVSTAHLAQLKAYVAAGKPVLGIRTASHAFAPKQLTPGYAAWPEFDREILGGSYRGHEPDRPVILSVAPGAAEHPVLSGIDPAAFATRKLYWNATLAPSAKPLLMGRDATLTVEHHVAWVNQVGAARVFNTSMGMVNDFANPAFRRLMLNAVAWTLDRPLPPLPAKRAGLSPDAALAAFQIPAGLTIERIANEPAIAKPVFLNFDERGRMWVVQYRQYPNPAGLTRVSRDEVWRSVYDRVSPPPPRQFPGADRVTILSSSRADGVFDQQRDFVSGLNITTAVERGRGGVWVLNPPYLLCYPDANGDDVPDGDPVVHLDGFNFEDTHSVANSLRWGPDGWLYGAVGSTVTTTITRPGIDRQPLGRISGQGIWRYHPESRQFELFAEGGGNTFGVEFDDQGRVFSGHNGGNTRGFYYQQGAFEQKGFEKHGPLSNPYAFGHFPALTATHPIKRFSHNFIVYGGGALPASFTGRILAIDPLNRTMLESLLTPSGSTYTTTDQQTVIGSTDTWFRPVDIKTGPDGAIYLADWYDRQVNHYRNHGGEIDPSLGRIYRLQAAGAKPMPAFDLARLTSTELIAQLRQPNRWFRQTALRLLADRKDPAVLAPLRRELATASGQFALEALWALNLSGGLDDATTLAALDHREAQVRLWTVRLRGDARTLPATISQRLADLARSERDLEVRSQLACTARRLPPSECLAIIRGLLTHETDATDPRQPLHLWWAIEACAETGREGVVALACTPDASANALLREHLLPRIMRRYAAAGTRKDLMTCAELLARTTDPTSAQRLLSGFSEAYAGRSLSGLPDELVQALAKHGGGSLAMRVRAGDQAAIREALATIAAPARPLKERLACIAVLGEVDVPGAVPVLLAALATEETKITEAVLRALARTNDATIPGAVLAAYPRWKKSERNAAQTLLASRPAWAREFTAAVQHGTIPAPEVGLTVVRSLRLHADAELATTVNAIWGNLGNPTTAEMEQEIGRINQVLAGGNGNPRAGRELYRISCAICHPLFGEGQLIGPDLTSAKRDDLESLLLAIVNPNAEIREGFTTCLITTKDGRSLAGFIADEDARVIVLRGLDGQLTTIDRSQITHQGVTGASLMPEGLLAGLAEQQVRDLFAYLRAPQPLSK